MKFFRKDFLILLLILFSFFAAVNCLPLEFKSGRLSNVAFADDVDEKLEKLEKEIRKTQGELEDVASEIEKISRELNSLSSKLNVTEADLSRIKTSINKVTARLLEIEKNLRNKNRELDHKEKVRDATIRAFYKKSRINPLELIFSMNSNVVNVAQNITYYKKFLSESRRTIYEINLEINQFNRDKKEAKRLKGFLEQKRKELSALQQRLSSQVKSAQTSLGEREEERRDLEKKLAELTAKQRELLAEKTGTFSTSVGLVPPADDPASRVDYDPGFSPAFAAFSFGAPHRKGMSQYGAYGRAKEGQDYEEILKAYYGDVEIKKIDDIPGEINTDRGTLDFEGNYLKGIAEMPATWDANDLAALKAQAVASRTYALSYVGWRIHGGGGGGRICTSEHCQVYRSDRVASSAADNWHKAVEETEGEVIVSNKTGEIISAWYASTAGGYTYSYTTLGHTTSGGWDTKCGTQACWTDEAYENIAKSPWFYKAWYKTRSGKTCGRKHPWLTEEEFADIINALIIFENDEGAQTHLSQVDANSCWSAGIEDIWDEGEVKEKSREYGGGVSSVDSVDVAYSTSGVTSKVTVNTDKGRFSFSGADFKYIFNLRAPAAIHLKSLLFNIEEK